MNIGKKNLIIAFIISFILFLLAPNFFPKLNLFFFVPPLIIAFYKKSLVHCLWLAFFCGLFLDLLSSRDHLGIYAFSYCLTTRVLYGQRLNFFADNISTLALMTLFFSITTTVAQAILISIGEGNFLFSGFWVITDLILMPLCDACYALICFTIPALLMLKLKNSSRRRLSH